MEGLIMITHEDIDRMKYPEIGNRMIKDATWLDFVKIIGKYIAYELRQAKRHITGLIFLGVYFL